MEYATVHTTLYDNNGKVAGTRNGFLDNSYLEPNAKSSFTIPVVDASIPLDQIGIYTLGISLR